MVAQSTIKKASGFNSDVADIQDIITGNSAKLGLSIGAPIGNSKTGQSDGMLGGRTSNALEQLVLLAQIHGNVAEGERNSGFDTRNKGLVEQYLKDTGVDPADISRMMTALEAVTAKVDGKPSLLDKHYSTAQVDVASLKVPDIKVADATPTESPTEIKTGFNDKSGATAEATPAPEPKPAGKEIQMTFAEYLDLKRSIDNKDAVTDGDKLKVRGYEEAFAQYQKDSPLAAASAALLTAKNNYDNLSKDRTALEETRDTIENDPALQEKFERLKKTDIAVVVNGERITTSFAELEERYGARFNDGWSTAGDKVDVVALRAAMDEMLENVQPGDVSKDNQDLVAISAEYKRLKDTERQLDGFGDRVHGAYTGAIATYNTEIAKAAEPEFQLTVFIPDVVPASPTAEQAPAVAASESPTAKIAKLGS